MNVSATEEVTDELPDYSADMFTEEPKQKTTLIRRQRHQQREGHASAAAEAHPLDRGKSQFRKAQQADDNLRQHAQSVTEGMTIGEDGLLHRRLMTDGTGEIVDQLVLPTKYSNVVMKTAHSLPMAGHLGQPTQRSGFWPGIHTDVKNLSRVPEGSEAHSLQTTTTDATSTPFERIAMDLVGPLPRTKAGHRYILTVVPDTPKQYRYGRQTVVQ